jgi:hypothetical protein
MFFAQKVCSLEKKVHICQTDYWGKYTIGFIYTLKKSCSCTVMSAEEALFLETKDDE